MSPGIQTRLLAAQSDERLVALVRQGHERAFEAMVHRYRRALLRYCQRLSLSDARAEDVLQQSLLNAWVALRRGAEVRELRPWLYRIVHNVAVNSMRGEQPLLDLAALGESSPEALDAAASRSTATATPNVDEVLAVRDAFAGMADLPPMQREVIVRTAVGGHSHEEVATALGISDGAVRGLLYRARAQLRAAIAAVMPPPLIAWAVGSSGRGAPASARIAEIAGGAGAAGGAGLTGLAVKGGIVAITAGVAITGAVVVPSHRRSPTSRAASRAHRRVALAAGTAAVDSKAVSDSTPSPPSSSLSAVLDASRTSRGSSAHRQRRRPRRNASRGGGAAVQQAPVAQPVHLAPQPQPPATAGPPPGGDRHRSHDRTGGKDRASSGSDAPATSADGGGDTRAGQRQEGGSSSREGSSGLGSYTGGDGGGEASHDETQTEEPKVEEPKVEEPKVEEPKVEEPKVEEPAGNEPKEGEPLSHDSALKGSSSSSSSYREPQGAGPPPG